MVDIVRSFPITSWSPTHGGAGSSFAELLERGEVLYLPRLGFEFRSQEERFLSIQWSDGKSKNINIRPSSDSVRGAVGGAADVAQLRAMLERYTRLSEQLVTALMP